MIMFWRVVGALAVIGLITASQPTCAFACSCIAPGPPAEALAQATAVFAGEVSAVAAPASAGTAAPVRVTFNVTQSWKGAPQPTIVVGTPDSSASCGVEFVKGERYLVYATESEGQLQTNLCSRTALLSAAAEDLAALGAGQAPSGPTTLPATGLAPQETDWLLPLGLGAGLVGLGALAARRRRAA